MLKFTKMHGIANDYVYIDLMDCQALPGDDIRRRLAIQMSDRHTGVGGDGVIFIEPSTTGADARMRIFNLDGSEAMMCGNGIRCVAEYMVARRHFAGDSISIQSQAGNKQIHMLKNDGGRLYRVDMGEPVFDAEQIPVLATDPRRVEVRVGENTVELFCVSMGNPHGVALWDDLDTLPIKTLGPAIEFAGAFPQRCNVEFISVSGGEITMRVWERGSGETMACGTGACACAVAAMEKGLVKRGPVVVHLKGGDLLIDWDAETNHVFMTGPAVIAFDGEWPHEI